MSNVDVKIDQAFAAKRETFAHPSHGPTSRLLRGSCDCATFLCATAAKKLEIAVISKQFTQHGSRARKKKEKTGRLEK